VNCRSSFFLRTTMWFKHCFSNFLCPRPYHWTFLMPVVLDFFMIPPRGERQSRDAALP
jgi:hypothetical protein